MYSAFIDKLKKEIAKGLPGWEAQKLMAPMGREQSRYKPLEKESRESAVLIWLYPNEDKIYVRLILRAEFGVHSGQVAFPGGRIDENDGSLWDTALREAHEEIGLSAENVVQVGELTSLYIPPSNFWVHPFIGTGSDLVSGIINKAEVQKYFDVEIFQLLQPELKQEGLITRNTGEQIITPSYLLDGHTVWGATAMILSELEELIRRTLKG